MEWSENMLNARYRPLQTPESLLKQLPCSEAATETVDKSRQQIKDILNGDDSRMLVIAGPCSIHDPEAALDLARRIKKLQEQQADNVFLVMRVYNEKPRTKQGWRGYLYDPYLDGSNRVQLGVYQARQLLLNINELGVPVATEFLDVFMPQYFDDLVSWAAIGARSSESTIHRALASGLSMPVGFKNATSGNLQVAVDGAAAARWPQQCLNMDSKGRVTLCENVGNPNSHVVLRGGDTGPNYDKAAIKHAASLMQHAEIEPQLIVDCSHGNSDKSPEKQKQAIKQVCGELSETRPYVRGMMLEGNIRGGNQDLDEPLSYGVSITDPCMSWEETEECVNWIAEAVSLKKAQTV